MTDTAKNTVSDELPSLLEQWALDIDRDGTPSQAGPSVEELRQLAQSLRSQPEPAGVDAKTEQLLIDAFVRGESWRKRNDVDRYVSVPDMVQKAARDYADATLSALTEQQGEAQCCMCGKKGLSTIEGDGGTECQLEDGRWTCSQDCYYTAVDWFSRLSAAPSNPVISDEMEILAKDLRRYNDWLMSIRIHGHEITALQAGNAMLNAAAALSQTQGE